MLKSSGGEFTETNGERRETVEYDVNGGLMKSRNRRHSGNTPEDECRGTGWDV